jgi:predicted Zn-dependent peptidase
MYTKFHTRNGLRVIVSPMPHMASVSLGIWVGVGGRHESERQSGLSHFIEHMLFKGTHDLTAKELKESIEGVGGSFNGFTSDEVTCYMVKVPARYMELGMDILSDMVLNARFDEKDIAKEKFVVGEEIKMYRDQPSDHVFDLLGSIMWPDNPLGRPLTGNMATVRSFNKKEVLGFKEDNYHPANMAIVAAGKITPKRVFNYVMGKFSEGEKKKRPSISKPVVSQRGPRAKIAGSRTHQTHIAMGFRVDETDIGERFAVKMMNIILGGNMSSRLFEELREKHGLCYDISSSYKRHSDTGELQIHAGVDSDKALKAVMAILDELKKIKDVGVTNDELERAKKYARGQFLLAMEGTSTRMLWLGDRLMVHDDIPDLTVVLKRINRVTTDEVQKACARLFKASAINLGMIGKLSGSERKKITKELGKL